MSEISVRSATPDDVGYVFSSWLKSFKDLNHQNKWVRNNDFFPNCHARVEKILRRETCFVWIAHPNEDKEVILGYIAVEYEGESPVIHYVYVEPRIRRMGIARMLFNHCKIDLSKRTTFTHWTFCENSETRERFDLIKKLMREYREFSYNPYYGENNG